MILWSKISFIPVSLSKLITIYIRLLIVIYSTNITIIIILNRILFGSLHILSIYNLSIIIFHLVLKYIWCQFLRYFCNCLVFHFLILCILCILQILCFILFLWSCSPLRNGTNFFIIYPYLLFTHLYNILYNQFSRMDNLALMLPIKYLSASWLYTPLALYNYSYYIDLFSSYFAYFIILSSRSVVF